MILATGRATVTHQNEHEEPGPLSSSILPAGAVGVPGLIPHGSSTVVTDLAVFPRLHWIRTTRAVLNHHIWMCWQSVCVYGPDLVRPNAQVHGYRESATSLTATIQCKYISDAIRGK